LTIGIVTWATRITNSINVILKTNIEQATHY